MFIDTLYNSSDRRSNDPYSHQMMLCKAKADEAESTVMRLELSVQDGENMRVALSKQFDNLQSWADVYNECDMDTKKMILSRIMRSVRVSRDYEIEIDLTVDCEHLGVLHDPGSILSEASRYTPKMAV